MWQANWTSLGIIVTLFSCMVQRLASSMRLTTYASAASCRHIMALPWKHKSYLPTSRAILQTNCEKGSFLMRNSVLFWNCQISWRATVLGWYFLVFLTLPAQRNSFWGHCLPQWVGASSWLAPPFPNQMALPLQPSGPTVGLATMMVTWPHPPAILPPLPASLPLPSSSPPPSQVRASWLGMGGAQGRGPPSSLCQLFPLLLGPKYLPLPALPILSWCQFHSSHSIKQTERSCSKLEILQDSTN